MGFYNKDRRLVVGNYDTFAIPIIIKNHVPQADEEFIFTVRRTSEVPARMGRSPVFGGVVFQKTIFYSDLIMITDADENIVGCYFYVSATKSEAADIPEGINAYDLAYVCNTDEFELIPPSEFIAGEVLRYE